jgi:hypothetical protein
MPYDNFYNRDLARNLAAKNRAWAQVHAYSNVSGLHGGAHVKIGNASKHDAVDGTYNNDIELGQSYYMGEGYKHRDVGGSGFASGSFRDTGYESVEGAGSKEYHKDPNRTGGLRLGLPDALAGGKMALAVMPEPMPMPFVADRLAPAPMRQPIRPAGDGRSGGVVPKAQMPGSSMAGMGKITKKEKEALKSVLAKHGGGRSGGGDGRKRRAEIVKDYMKKHGCKMIEASKKVKELGLYKP